MSEFILASTSSYRRALVERLRIPFRCVSPDVDEEDFKTRTSDPLKLAVTLAREKAMAVWNKHPHATVVGGDQLASCDAQILGKPGTSEKAVEQLMGLSGKTHQLITAVCVASQTGVREFCDVTKLTMRPLSIDEARRYVELDQPIDCAGAYKFESLGVALFASVETDDMTSITGLPLMKLSSVLRELGWKIP